MGEVGAIESDRPVPGTRLRASPIGVRVVPSAQKNPESDSGAARLLVRARALGITTFDVGRGPEAARAERILATAFPEPDESLLILVRRAAADLADGDVGSGRRPAASLDARLRRSLDESESRLGSLPVGLLVWDGGGRSPPEPDVTRSLLDALVDDGRVGGWAEQVRDARSVPSGGAPPSPVSNALSGPLSMLDRGLLPPLETRAAVGPLAFFAEDPLGAGRLDGSRFDRPLVDRGPGTPPASLAELHREFDPVLRLGFLTAGRRRTLAQAALQFVLRWPWVASALVPMPPADRLAEITGVASSPPLSDDEVERVLALES